MRSSEFHSKLSQLAALSECSDHDLRELLLLFQDNAAFAKQATDEKRLDALLQLESLEAHEHESFIEDCMTRVMHPSDGNCLPTQLAAHTSDFIQIQSLPRSPARFKSRQVSKLTLALGISLVATLLGLLGATAWTVDFGRPQLSPRAEGMSVTEKRPENMGQARKNVSTIAPTRKEKALTRSGETKEPNPKERDQPKVMPRIELGDTSLGSTGEETDLKRDFEREQESKSETQLATTFANWTGGKLAGDQTANLSRRIGAGPISTAHPGGRLAMDNGTVLFFEGPFAGDLVRHDLLIVERGTVHLETSDLGGNSFQLKTPDSFWNAISGTALQLNVNELGQEGFVFEGRVDLRRYNHREPGDAITLTPQRLQQVLIENGDQPNVPTILAARGKKAFLGQVGFPDTGGEQTVQMQLPVWQTESPKCFSKFVNQFGGRKNISMDPLFVEHWKNFVERSQALNLNLPNSAPQFEQMMQKFFDLQNLEFPNQKPRDESRSGATHFQGSININGKEQQFDSFEDFQRAQKAANLKNSRLIQPVEQGQKQDFQGEINLNGRTFKFSTPQQFNAMRRRAHR